VDVEIPRAISSRCVRIRRRQKHAGFHLIGGLDTPNAGEIFFRRGKSFQFSESRLTDFRNRVWALCFQAYHLVAGTSPRAGKRRLRAASRGAATR